MTTAHKTRTDLNADEYYVLAEAEDQVDAAAAEATEWMRRAEVAAKTLLQARSERDIERAVDTLKHDARLAIVHADRRMAKEEQLRLIRYGLGLGRALPKE